LSDDKVIRADQFSRFKTMSDSKAKRLVDLVKAGTPQKEAEEIAGISLAFLKKADSLKKSTLSLLERAEATGLLKDVEAQRQLAKARLIELAMQDEDLGVAARAARALLGTDVKIGVGVQIINRDAKVVESLRSLGVIEDAEIIESSE
jgi:hypothetical protein